MGEYRKDSQLRDKMVDVYEKMYGEKPQVVAIHAGLSADSFTKKWKVWTAFLWKAEHVRYPHLRGEAGDCFRGKSLELSGGSAESAEGLTEE